MTAWSLIKSLITIACMGIVQMIKKSEAPWDSLFGNNIIVTIYALYRNYSWNSYPAKYRYANGNLIIGARRAKIGGGSNSFPYRNSNFHCCK